MIVNERDHRLNGRMSLGLAQNLIGLPKLPVFPLGRFQLRRHVRRYANSIAGIDVGVRHLLVQCLAMQPILDEIDMIVVQLGRMFLIQHQQHGC